jgi:hypothetical protein
MPNRTVADIAWSRGMPVPHLYEHHHVCRHEHIVTDVQTATNGVVSFIPAAVQPDAECRHCPGMRLWLLFSPWFDRAAAGIHRGRHIVRQASPVLGARAGPSA